MFTPEVKALFEGLEQGGRAITSTRRLARQAAQRYADWKIRAGAAAWPTPRVRVYDDWLREVWQAAFEHDPAAPRLLSEDQELLLWEQVIRERAAAGDHRHLLQQAGTARAARQTWRRLHEWRIHWRHLDEDRSADTEAFSAWAARFRELLRGRNWITSAELPRYLVDHRQAWLGEHRQPTWWMGFDVLPLAQKRILGVLQEDGVRQNRFNHAGVEDPDTGVVACTDVSDQWTRIARWARSELAGDPTRTLGVVCPELRNHRDEIEEILEDVLHPELSWRVDAPRVYHLSLGRPLPDYPIVRSALDLLHWTAYRIPFALVSRTLRSPYAFGGGDDLEPRIQLELRLRKRGPETFTLIDLLAATEGQPALADVRRMLAHVSGAQLPREGGPNNWAALFTDWLRNLGWPGDRALDSHEHQALNAWRELLSRFAALHAIQSRWGRAEALKKISSMTASRVLQFHDDQAPLQIMGGAESAGLWFDKLWLADMSDAVWPPAVQPDPFLPIAVQKRHGLPDASAQAVLEHARMRTANSLASAGQTWVSFASRDAEVPAALSALFSQHPMVRDDGVRTHAGRVEQLLASEPQLEIVADEYAPPIGRRRLRGGVALVADQARCPFRALAHHRLDARALPVVTPGLDAMERGTLAHDAAKRMWDRLQDRDTLNAMTEAAAVRLVAECVQEAVARQSVESTFQRRVVDVERQRLTALLTEWLALDRQRESFAVVGTEIDAQVALGEATFRLRVDRIDELPDGRRLIIDYKTGELTGVKDWLDARMEEPQLPMYALSLTEPIAGLAAAAVRRGDCKMVGVGDAVDGVPGLTSVNRLGFDDMDGLKSQWASALKGLVDEYRQGIARVDPKTPRTCRLCDAMPLCRIFERPGGAGS